MKEIHYVLATNFGRLAAVTEILNTVLAKPDGTETYGVTLAELKELKRITANAAERCNIMLPKLVQDTETWAVGDVVEISIPVKELALMRNASAIQLDRVMLGYIKRLIPEKHSANVSIAGRQIIVEARFDWLIRIPNVIST